MLGALSALAWKNSADQKKVPRFWPAISPRILKPKGALELSHWDLSFGMCFILIGSLVLEIVGGAESAPLHCEGVLEALHCAY